jgi:hypothetical protein
VADDVMRRSASEAQAAPKGTTLPPRTESRADRARRLVYRSRFAAFYFLLAVVAGGAIGALVVLVSRGSPAPAPAWSAWEPTGTDWRRVAQIGDRVGDRYRLPSGNALAAVTYAGPPIVAGSDDSTTPVRALAVRPDTSGGRAEEDDIDTFPAGSTATYQLCGLGPVCSIAEGQPSAERDALLRREALELALYSFRYTDVQSVFVDLPPRIDTQAQTVTTRAVFLERSDVRPSLGQPLDRTLTAPLTPGIGEMSAEELRVVDRITRSRIYAYESISGQDGSPILVLSPAPGA